MRATRTSFSGAAWAWPRSRCIRFNASLTVRASHGFATAAARWKVATLETYRRTVAGAFLAAMVSMSAATVSGEAGAPGGLFGAPAGEDRHVGAQRALGVAGIGAARRFGMLAHAGTNFGFRDGGRHGRDLVGGRPIGLCA